MLDCLLVGVVWFGLIRFGLVCFALVSFASPLLQFSRSFFILFSAPFVLDGFGTGSDRLGQVRDGFDTGSRREKQIFP